MNAIDLSYNSFVSSSLKSLFSECLKIEKVSLINNFDEADLDCSLLDAIREKFENVNSVPLKKVELKVNNQMERLALKNLFKNKWPQSFVKSFNYFSKFILEIKVDYI